MRVVLFSEANSKFGEPLLQDLLEHPEISVAGLVTTAEARLCDYYVGEQSPADLPALAKRANIPVLRPEHVNGRRAVSAISRLEPDYLLIGNYQKILHKELLRVPRLAVINFHPSPLPRYAGLAPFFWMALHGERESGVSAVITTEGIDAGPILAQRPVRLSGMESCGQIRDILFAESRTLWREVIPRLLKEDLRATPQYLSRRSYFSAPTDAHRTLDWNRPAERILRTVRAGSPRPGALVTGWPAETRIFGAEKVPIRGMPLPPPGRIVAHPRQGLLVSCADSWIKVTSIGPAAPESLSPREAAAVVG